MPLDIAHTRRKLAHLPLEDLRVSELNVRRHGAKDIADFARNIAALGILQPLLVRKCESGHEVVAGKRRFLAAQKLHAQDATAFDTVPVIILAEHDDAAAIEASLAENIARLPMDEMDQYEAFAALIENGMEASDIAAHFAITEQTVTRRMALGRVHADIRRLYRKGAVDPRTLRLLTLATSERQKEWLALAQDDSKPQPPMWQLKAWLLGGVELKVSSALFDLERYTGDITRDLFDDDGSGRYFSDTAQFWHLQNEAIAEAAEQLRGNGWPVTTVNPDQKFEPHLWQEATKKDGGHAVIIVESDGKVDIRKGLITKLEAKARAKAEAKRPAMAATSDGAVPDDAVTAELETTDRPELSGPLANYLDLVRLSAVQLAVAKKPAVALRLLLAHIITGHGHFCVTPDSMTTHNGEIGQAIDTSPDRVAFKSLQAEAAEKLGLDATLPHLMQDRDWQGTRIWTIYETLSGLTDAQVMKILAVVMAEALDGGTELIDKIGTALAVKPEWTGADNTTFFELVRDRQVAQALVRDVSGEAAARSHTTATAVTMKKVVNASLTGNGRTLVKGWLPKWLHFPQAQYTNRKLKA